MCYSKNIGGECFDFFPLKGHIGMCLLESFDFYGLYVSNLLGKLGLDNLDQTKRQDWPQTYTISDP